MKKCTSHLPAIYRGHLIFLMSIFLYTNNPLIAVTFLTSNDPYPVYSAVNPLGAYTYWENCEPEYHAMFSASVFRQSANFGKSGPCTEGSCPQITTTTGTTTCPCTTSNSCQAVCNTDVNIGDIHGPWNMIAPFYAEANGNTQVQEFLIQQLQLLDDSITGLSGCTGQFNNAVAIVAALTLPSLSDVNQRFGFFKVPVEYRKYGIRFKGDITTCWDFGLRIQAGVASIRQNVCFDDQTCDAMGPTCNISVPSTTATCGTNCCVPNPLVNNCCAKQLVINGIMKKEDFIAELLGLNIRDFCKTDIEDFTLSLYWSHCFEYNAGISENECWPHYTIAPYIIGEVTFPISHETDPNRIFALPFGNNGHWGLGVTGGFTLNFIETVELGLEAGFTHFTSRCYSNYPVPTNDFQTGMFTRKANLTIEPGSNWNFAATLGAYHFLSCLSAYVQFVGVHHCKDDFCNIIPLAGPNNIPAPPVSNINVRKLKEDSQWSSNFVNVSFTYDISKHTQLGLFWQAPVRQEFAYRPTTVMFSLIFEY